MAVPHQQSGYYGWYEGHDEQELSTIHKFTLGTSALSTDYRGSGIVKGRVLNQFSMDENTASSHRNDQRHLPDQGEKAKHPRGPGRQPRSHRRRRSHRSVGGHPLVRLTVTAATW